jgi:hypothetical protein
VKLYDVREVSQVENKNFQQLYMYDMWIYTCGHGKVKYKNHLTRVIGAGMGERRMEFFMIFTVEYANGETENIWGTEIQQFKTGFGCHLWGTFEQLKERQTKDVEAGYIVEDFVEVDSLL